MFLILVVATLDHRFRPSHDKGSIILLSFKTMMPPIHLHASSDKLFARAYWHTDEILLPLSLPHYYAIERKSEGKETKKWAYHGSFSKYEKLYVVTRLYIYQLIF